MQQLCICHQLRSEGNVTAFPVTTFFGEHTLIWGTYTISKLCFTQHLSLGGPGALGSWAVLGPSARVRAARQCSCNKQHPALLAAKPQAFTSHFHSVSPVAMAVPWWWRGHCVEVAGCWERGEFMEGPHTGNEIACRDTRHFLP